MRVVTWAGFASLVACNSGTMQSSFTVTRVEPDTVLAGISTPARVFGTAFPVDANADFANEGIEVDSSYVVLLGETPGKNVMRENAGALTLTLPGLMAGTHEVTVLSPVDTSAVLTPGLRVVASQMTSQACVSDDDCDDPCSELVACSDNVCVLGPVDRDQDGDGYIAAVCTGGDDCDDNNASAFPGQIWYADCDGDGRHRAASVTACDQTAADVISPCLDGSPPAGWSNAAPGVGADCDDEGAGCWASCATEDADGDGACPSDAGDCDDSAATGSTCTTACGTYFADEDNDGYGSSLIMRDQCTEGGGFVADSSDCDDRIGFCGAGCFPTNLAPDLCDGYDQDCDGGTDEDYSPDNSCFRPGVCADRNLASSCAGGSETPCATGSESGVSETLCNGDDDDCDGGTDEDYSIDSSCGVGACQTNNTPSSCVGGVETLCDPGTPGTEGPPGDATCTNSSDDDCDGDEDGADVDCHGECGDTIDNDGDGLSDLADPGCDDLADASELGANECDDGVDNDGDGNTDTADTACPDPFGTDESDCGDGVCEGGETSGSCAPDCTGIQYDNTSSVGHTIGATTSITMPHITGSQNDRYIVVCVGIEGGEGVDSITYGGAPLTFVAGADSGGATGSQIQMWHLVAPASGTNDVIVEFSSVVDVAGVAALTYAGVDPAIPVEARVGQFSATGSPRVDLNATVSGAWIVGCVDVKGGDTTPMDPGLDINERYDFRSGSGVSADHGYAGGDMVATVPATNTFAFTPAVEDDWAVGAIELRPAP